MRNRFSCKQFKRRIIFDVIVFDYPSMTEAGIFAHADIGDNIQFRYFVLDGPDRFLYNAVRIISAGTDFIFVLRKAKEYHSRNAERIDLFRVFDYPVD